VFVAPITPRQKAIADCFGEVLGVGRVGLHDNFFELGGDSLKATELLMLFSQTLGGSPMPELLNGEGTVHAIDRDLDRQGPPECMVRMQAAGNLTPVFCLHDGYGQVWSYRQLVRLLGTDRPVFGVQYPGPAPRLDGRVPLQEMAQRYVKEIQAVQATGPYYLLGQCFGGLVAFEVAQQLRTMGETVAMLVLIDTRYPAGLFSQLLGRVKRVVRWLTEPRQSFRQRLEFAGNRLIGFFKWVRNEIVVRSPWPNLHFSKASDRGPAKVGQDSMIASRQIEYRYRPRPYSGAMALISPGPPHNQLGWQRVANDGLRVIEIPVTDHGYEISHLTRDPAVARLASELRMLFDTVD
jgi:acyl carrier protein